MDKAAYLLVNFLAVAVPFIFSFHRRIRFYRHFVNAFTAIFLVALPFVFWDIGFTRAGHWGFTEAYIMGLSVAGLPVEELLFFVCIPFACLFTYFVLRDWLLGRFAHYQKGFARGSLLAGAALAILSITVSGGWYTFVSFLTGGVALILLSLTRPFYLTAAIAAFMVLLLPFILVNGALTGSLTAESIVWYSQNAITGHRVFTIPVEDFVYAFTLIVSNIAVFEWLERKPGAKVTGK